MSEITVTVCKEALKFNSTFRGVKVKASGDGVAAKLLCDALYEWENKSKSNAFWLKESFEQRNVMAYAKINTRYHSLGLITTQLYDNYKKIFKKSSK